MRIAELSRDTIEFGLGWSWTPLRVLKQMQEKNTNVIVTHDGNEVIGFAVMQYMDSEARLNLFGVHPNHRRRGIGTRMIEWLEKTALINGNRVVYLEARWRNHGARAFYKTLGYKEVQQISGYYKGRENAIRMAHDLWSNVSPG